MKKSSLGFTLIELMIVIAIAGILALVTVPKYQAIMDHYHLESSSQIVAVQLRNAKQYAMDRRTDVYVMFNSTSVQTFYIYHDEAHDSYQYISLETQQNFSSGIIYASASQGVKIIPSTLLVSGVNHVIDSPLYDQCLVFDRKGFLPVSPVSIVLTNARPPHQSVKIYQTFDDLAVKISW